MQGVNETSAKPLVTPGPDDAVPAIFQIRLSSEESFARQQEAVASVAVSPFACLATRASDELFRATHVHKFVNTWYKACIPAEKEVQLGKGKLG